MMSLSTLLSKQTKIYKSIEEMPIYNFHKIMTEKDTDALKWMLYKPDEFVIKPKEIERVGKQWIKLYDEYLEHFGISKQYEKVMNQEDKITKLIISRWLQDDKSLESIIKIEQQRLNELTGKKKKKSTFEEDVAIIEKYRGIGIDIKKTSVKMFYTYIKLMEKDGKEN